MTLISTEAVAKAIAETMVMIREDVAAGNGAAIEADAVLVSVAYKISERCSFGSEAREAFLSACDLDELIPAEAFTWPG